MTTPSIPTPPEGIPSHIQTQQAAAHAGISEGVQQVVRKQYTGPKRDKLVQATRGLRKPAGKKSIANDPMQSDFIGEVGEPPSAGEGYPFPKPGLAYYMAQAMVINVQADSNMMMAYNSEQTIFYKSIELQWDNYAKMDQEFYEQEGQKAIVTASFAVASATLAVGMAGYMGAKTAKFTAEQTGYMGEKQALTAQLGEKTARAASIGGDEEELDVVAGGEGETPAELSTQERQINEEHESLVNQLENEKALASTPQNFSEEEATNILNAKYERLRGDAYQTRDAALDDAYKARSDSAAQRPEEEQGFTEEENAELDRRIGSANESLQDRLNNKLPAAQNEELQRANANEANPAEAETYDKQIDKADKARDKQVGKIKEKREALTKDREDVSDKISELEKRRGEYGSKMMSLQSIPNVVGQFAGLGTGVISITQQAATVRTRDTSDKIKSINQTALQGLIRQWNTLAGYVDQTFPAYVDAIKSFNQALQRV